MGLNKDKGLKSLIGDLDEVYSKELGIKDKEVEEIELDKIKPNPFQPRKNFDQNSINELSKSIEKYGLIQPIIVLKKQGDYILIAGERRYRATKLLGNKKIKALISDAKEEKLRELALIENIQRENLNPIELANSYKDLLQEHNITQEELSTLINKSRTQITNTLRLLNLDKKTQELIIDGKISQGHAKVLIGLDKNDEKMVVDSIVGQKLNVRDTENIVKKIKNKQNKIDDQSYLELDKLKNKFNEVGISCKIKNNELSIYFNNLEHIKKLIGLLNNF